MRIYLTCRCLSRHLLCNDISERIDAQLLVGQIMECSHIAQSEVYLCRMGKGPRTRTFCGRHPTADACLLAHNDMQTTQRH